MLVKGDPSTSPERTYHSSVSAYHGYHTSGGALEVGRSSTKAVVYAVVIVMIANLLLTQMLLG